MKITPQARRRITGAVRALNDLGLSERWGRWDAAGPANQIRTDLPYEIAEIAFQALTAAERAIHAQLEGGGVDEDTRADLANDLGYVQAIETTFRGSGIGR